jgi:hypothetical protein
MRRYGTDYDHGLRGYRQTGGMRGDPRGRGYYPRGGRFRRGSSGTPLPRRPGGENSHYRRAPPLPLMG